MSMDMIVSGFGPGPVAMSSREIAELCEKQHKHVLRDIETMLAQVGFDAKGYAHLWTHPQNGQTYPEYRLPRDLTVTLITGYRADLRYKVIKRLEELEGQKPALPDLSDPAVLLPLLSSYAQRTQIAEAKVEAMSEDVAAHHRLTKADGSLNITEAAKNLGIRPKDLFDWLARNGWIYKRPNSAGWLGYQTKCNQGLVEHKTTTVLRGDGTEKITEQVRITAKGLSALARTL